MAHKNRFDVFMSSFDVVFYLNFGWFGRSSIEMCPFISVYVYRDGNMKGKGFFSQTPHFLFLHSVVPNTSLCEILHCDVGKGPYIWKENANIWAADGKSPFKILFHHRVNRLTGQGFHSSF